MVPEAMRASGGSTLRTIATTPFGWLILLENNDLDFSRVMLPQVTCLYPPLAGARRYFPPPVCGPSPEVPLLGPEAGGTGPDVSTRWGSKQFTP